MATIFGGDGLEHTSVKIDQSSLSRPIVIGVGASAGGLEAIHLFLSGLPDQHGLIIVLIQHLDPDHESLMPELIAAKTKSPVHSVKNEMTAKPGHIYLIPPGFEMEIHRFKLKLKRFDSPRGLRRPIDTFFKSLAASHAENGVAVILSGTGSDGSEGAREVKGAGGLVFVQDPEQAKYDGMPMSVLNHNCEDAVIKSEEILYLIHDYFDFRIGVEPGLLDDTSFIERVTRHVKLQTGHDFKDYKPGTILRRIAVRMSVLGLASTTDYLKYLVERKEEADLLFRDLLINVTSFFRDPQFFEVLQRDVIATVVSEAEEDEDIRVWIAGCSTGEEAYSVGILILQELERVSKTNKVAIFGTDIDEQALTIARAGRYSALSCEAVPDQYLERYFRPLGDDFEIGSELREVVRFSRHSFIKDPPFSKLDIVSCRNVLIYMNEYLQETALRVFHYGLDEDGFLFLGSSENPKKTASYFKEFNTHCRMFRRLPGRANPLNLGSMSDATNLRVPAVSKKSERNQKFTVFEKAINDSYLPPHLHLSPNFEVIYSSEKVTRFLAVKAGMIRIGIFDFIKPELETIMRRLLRKLRKADEAVTGEWQGELGGQQERLVIDIRKLADTTILVVINDKLMLRDEKILTEFSNNTTPDSYVRDLEIELDEAKIAVQSTVEELETSNEELKSSNEEMMSMNEELQSGNEELTTINDELQAKVRELHQANLDLNNFVSSARVATVFLDEGLRLRSYTPEAEAYFSFAPGDIGRLMDDLNSTIDKDALLTLCAQTIEDKVEREGEFISKEGGFYIAAQVMPYSPEGKDTSGVVFTLLDVTELREAVDEADKLRAVAEDRLSEVEQIYKGSHVAMALISPEMKFLKLNEKLAEMTGEPFELHVDRPINDIIPSLTERATELVNEAIKTRKPISSETLTGFVKSAPDIVRTWESDWVPYHIGDKLIGVNVNFRDITKELETSKRLRHVLLELDHRVKNMLANVLSIIKRAGAEAASDDGVYETLHNRIMALSKTHALLTSERWSSAGLHSIVVPETVDVFGEDRIKLSGPDLRVNAETTLALGMVVHELATNAAKYGALSVPDGVLSIEWNRVIKAKSDKLTLVWEESGGPNVKEPAKKGFGTKLIYASIEGTLQGKLHADWKTDGVRFEFDLDFAAVSSLEKV